MNKVDFLSEKLLKRKQEGKYRQMWQPCNLVDFSSNDYLGFARSEALKQNINKSITDFIPNGSTGSRLLSGNSALHEETEKYIAAFHDAESGLIFNSGYDANIGFFSCIAGRNDTIIYDEYIHASIKDGARLSMANAYSFRHNDVARLKNKISNAKGNVFVAVESIYSMTGDEAPLLAIAQLLNEYVYLIVDEAHATGVIGNNGGGVVQQLGLEDACLARMHTFGKALGCHGAIVLGSNDLRNYLINFARSFIYTTALPPHAIISVREAYKMLNTSNAETNQLKSNLEFFNVICQELGLTLIKGDGAIRNVPVPDNEKAVSIALAIQKNGFDVKPILSPTVPAGNECLRICLHAFNTKDEMYGLIKCLKQLL